MKFVAAFFVALVLLASTRAQAQPGNTPPGQTAPNRAYLPVPQLERPLPPETRTVSYGMQVFLTDAAVWAVAIAAGESDAEDLASLAVAGLFLGGPIVHLVHGNGSSAALSLLARGGLPVLGGTLLYSTCSESERDEFFGCLGHLFLGGLIGYGGALVIDWFYLAKKEEAVATTGWASLTPTLQLHSDGAQAGMAFVF